MEGMELLLTRRTVRRFTGEPLAPEQLEQIVRAGMSAPSANARRPWHILTVESAEKRLALKPLCQWWQMLDKAGAAVVVCADTALCENMQPEYQVDDCAAACENMLLAAYALGLGGVWLGVCESAEQAPAVKHLLGIPDGMRIMGMLALGHPSVQPKPIDRFKKRQWHKEVW